MAVTCQTPNDIRLFITQKCGAKEEGFEGKKVGVDQRGGCEF
jgi:hypothetical protein